MTVCLTFDLDWAPDFMLDALTERLEAAALPATVFCTHDSPGVRRLVALSGVEVALHPSFFGEDRDEARILGTLKRTFPAARGLRCHGLYYHSGLLFDAHRAGIAYLSNDVRFLEGNLAPTYDYAGVVRLPIYWEDDVHAIYFGEDPAAYTVDRLKLEQPGMKVFNFHPVHLLLNTRDLRRYRRHKPALDDPVSASSLRQAGPGIDTIFEGLVEALARRGVAPTTLGTASDRFTVTNHYEGCFADFVDPAQPVPDEADDPDETDHA